MDYSSAYAIGAVFGSIMMGFILGAAPLRVEFYSKIQPIFLSHANVLKYD